MQTVTTTLPSRPATAGIDRGPILITTHLQFNEQVTVSVGGSPRCYRLAKPVSGDAYTPSLALVRIDRTNMAEAEVYHLGIDHHTYLGTARLEPIRQPAPDHSHA